MVRMLAGTGELVRLPDDGHLLAKSGDVMWERLEAWLPPAPRAPDRGLTSRALEPVPSPRCASTPTTSSHGRPNVILDGSPTDGTILTVTHWPGPPTARGRRRRHVGGDDVPAARPPRAARGAELVSNNHFDQDGTVSIHALLAPSRASPPRSWRTSRAPATSRSTGPRAARCRWSSAPGPTARGPVTCLPTTRADGPALREWATRLSELCADVDRPPRAVGGRGRDAHGERGRRRGAVTSRSMSAPTSTSPSSTCPSPPRTAAATASAVTGSAGCTRWRCTTRTERLVVATVRGRSYDVELRYESWVQLRSRPLRLRRDLAPLAARLQDEETRRRRVDRDTGQRASSPASRAAPAKARSPPTRFVELLTDHLATAPGVGPLLPHPGAP